MSDVQLINWWAVDLLIIVFGKFVEYLLDDWRLLPLSYVLLVIGMFIGFIVLVKPLRENVFKFIDDLVSNR